jgi:hypothetical protein
MKNDTGESRPKEIMIRVHGPQGEGKTALIKAIRPAIRGLGIKHRIIDVQNNLKCQYCRGRGKFRKPYESSVTGCRACKGTGVAKRVQ